MRRVASVSPWALSHKSVCMSRSLQLKAPWGTLILSRSCIATIILLFACGLYPQRTLGQGKAAKAAPAKVEPAKPKTDGAAPQSPQTAKSKISGFFGHSGGAQAKQKTSQPTGPSGSEKMNQPAAGGPRVPRDARVKRSPDGTQRLVDRRGNAWTTDSSNRVREFNGKDVQARYSANGQPSFIRSTHNGATTTVTFGARGDRRIETVHPDGSRVVSRGGVVFSERRIVDRPGFVARTYVTGGTTQVRVYQTRVYMNQPYYVYVPAYYYRPAFYSWISTPWPVAISFNWGPAGAHFTPYPQYSSADLWLTDYALMNSQQQGSGAQQDLALSQPPSWGDYSQQPPANPEPQARMELAPDVKALLDLQVRQHGLDMRAAAAANATSTNPPAPPPPDAVPDVLKAGNKEFLISTDVNLAISADQTCQLTPSDVIFRTGDIDAAGQIPVVVVNSKPGDCGVNTRATIDLAALEEIQSQFEQSLDEGMTKIASMSGTNGIPNSPETAPTKVGIGQAPADDVRGLAQQNDADGQRSEAELNKATSGSQ